MQEETPPGAALHVSAEAPAKPDLFSGQGQQNLRCPRCDSTNTKFCYYNNYNLSQPRHFCKDCRRYWTKGGALRNVPVGGGTRKGGAKRAHHSSSYTKRAIPSKQQQHHSPSSSSQQLFPEPKQVSFLCSPDGDNHLLDASGSFSSLLASGGHLSSLLVSIHGDGGADLSLSGTDGQGMELRNSPGNGDSNKRNSAAPLPENFLGLPGDAGSYWTGGWSDVIAYNPGSMQLPANEEFGADAEH